MFHNNRSPSSSKNQVIATKSLSKSRLDIWLRRAKTSPNGFVRPSNTTPATKESLDRRSGLFYWCTLKACFHKGNDKKALKERSDSRFLLVKHPQMDSRGCKPGQPSPKGELMSNANNTTPATTKDSSSELMGSFLFIPPEVLMNCDFARNKEFTFEVRYSRFLVSMTIFPYSGILGMIVVLYYLQIISYHQRHY